MKKPNNLENQILQMLLAGDNGILFSLREQLKIVLVSSRKITGAGFFTEFNIPDLSHIITGCPSFKIGDVNGFSSNLKHGMGFLLYIKNGFLNMLEGYTYDEPWPEKFENFVLQYSNGQTRNMEELKKHICPFWPSP